ncbi:cytochrome P450 2J2-like [Asterias amurensis]|uniref:cytochrome P450 2J2-like n=1 Tax=Asterias amurensis TaxID=7602 RepID=UPI003AB19C81
MNLSLMFWGLVEARAVLIALVIFLGVSWFRRSSRYKNLPPGPFTGSWSSFMEDTFTVYDLLKSDVTRQPHQIFKRFSVKYGDLLYINTVALRIVVLNSCESIRQAFQNQHISDRPAIQVLKHTIEGDGVAFASGETWKRQRKLVLNFLRAFGVNRTSFEDKIALEAQHLNAEFRKHGGLQFNPSHLLANAVSNVICSVLFGRRYEYTDPKFKRLLHAIYRNVAIIGGSTGPLQMLPYIYLLKWFIPVIRETANNGRLIVEFAREVLAEHQVDFDPDNLRDFTDVYLKEMCNNNNNNITENKTCLTINDMCATASDLFIAGTETTSTALRWGLLHLMSRPDIQQRVQQELDSVVGRDRLPSVSDKPNLPYTMATLMELQRIGNILPLGIPHQASQDTTVMGYDIPKGTVVMPNMWCLTSDSKLWDEPDVLKPERFLDETGRNVIKYEEMMPFSTGRRMCIGEQLAKTELFIFLTHTLHQFNIEKPADSPPISFKGIMGVTLSPLPYEICATPRNF